MSAQQFRQSLNSQRWCIVSIVRDVERLFCSLLNSFESNQEANVYFDNIVNWNLLLAISYFGLV